MSPPFRKVGLDAQVGAPRRSRGAWFLRVLGLALVASLRWHRWAESNLAFLPDPVLRYLRDDFTWRYKSFRYRFEFALFDLLPSFYVERLQLVLGHVPRLSQAGGFRVGIVDFSRKPQIAEAIGAQNRKTSRVVTHVRDFPIELNPRNEQPTAACVRKLAPILADAVTRMVRDEVSARHAGAAAK